MKKEDPISLNDLETKLFASLHFANGTLPSSISDELDKYLKIEYFELKRNWNKELKDVENYGEFGMKACEIDDFGNDEFGQEFLSSWQNDKFHYDLFCPDTAK